MPKKNASKFTTDRETIQKWVEARGGWPAEVKNTSGPARTGILRIDFPGYSGEGELQRIEWDDFFKKFEEANLALVYDDETAGGEKSNFNELVGRATVEPRKRSVRTTRSAGRRQARPAQAARSTRAGRSGSTSRSTKAPARRGAASAAKKTPTRSSAGKRSTAGARGGRGKSTRKRSR